MKNLLFILLLLPFTASAQVVFSEKATTTTVVKIDTLETQGILMLTKSGVIEGSIKQVRYRVYSADLDNQELLSPPEFYVNGSLIEPPLAYSKNESDTLTFRGGSSIIWPNPFNR